MKTQTDSEAPTVDVLTDSPRSPAAPAAQPDAFPAMTMAPRRTKTVRLIVSLVLMVIVLGLIGWRVVRAVERRREQKDQQTELTTYTVARGDLHISITESGSLKATNSTRLWADVPGSARVAWLVQEGIRVDSGDTLVVMDTEEVEKNIEDTQIKLEQATSARIQAEEKLEIQKRQNQSDLEAAQVKLDVARLELARYEEGEVPKLLREATLKLDRAKVDLQVADDDLDSMDEYVEKGYFTQKDFEQRKLALREAENAVVSAEKELVLVEKYQIPKDRAQKQMDVKQAETNLDLVTRKGKSELAQKQAEVKQQAFTERSRTDRLTMLETMLGKMVILAPTPGLVVYGDDRRWWSRRDVEVGMEVRRGQVIITLPDLSQMEVILSINEVDLDKVKVGQATDIILDAFPGVSLRGTVAKVATLAERQSRWTSSDVRTFEVTAAIDMAHARAALGLAAAGEKAGMNGQLRPGMSAKAEIDVARLNRVVHVPVDAVFEEAGQHGCYVMEGGKPVWRPVEIGLNNRTHVHIKSGLAPGEKVCRYDPTLASGKKRSTTQPAKRTGDAKGPGASTRPTSRPAQPQENDEGGGAGRHGTRGNRAGRAGSGQRAGRS